MSAASHAAAMGMVLAAAGVGTISFEQAVAIYLRARCILRDGAECLAAPLPAAWHSHDPRSRRGATRKGKSS